MTRASRAGVSRCFVFRVAAHGSFFRRARRAGTVATVNERGSSFGLFAPVSGPALVSLFVAALSVSSALLLTLELDTPYGG